MDDIGRIYITNYNFNKRSLANFMPHNPQLLIRWLEKFAFGHYVQGLTQCDWPDSILWQIIYTPFIITLYFHPHFVLWGSKTFSMLPDTLIAWEHKISNFHSQTQHWITHLAKMFVLKNIVVHRWINGKEETGNISNYSPIMFVI